MVVCASSLHKTLASILSTGAGGMNEGACRLKRAWPARDTGIASRPAWAAELKTALGDTPRPWHTWLPGNTSEMTLSLFGHRQSHGRQLADVVPDCALVHWEKPPSHRSHTAGLLKSPLTTPRHGHCPHQAPTHGSWVLHTHTSESRLPASSRFLLENLQLFHYNQAVTEQSISVTSEC